MASVSAHQQYISELLIIEKMHTEYVTRPVCLTGGRHIGLIVFNS